MSLEIPCWLKATSIAPLYLIMLHGCWGILRSYPQFLICHIVILCTRTIYILGKIEVLFCWLVWHLWKPEECHIVWDLLIHLSPTQKRKGCLCFLPCMTYQLDTLNTKGSLVLIHSEGIIYCPFSLKPADEPLGPLICCVCTLICFLISALFHIAFMEIVFFLRFHVGIRITNTLHVW